MSDLFIPSGVDVVVGQDLKKSADMTQTVTYVRPKISTHALNLFGRLGSTPRLPMVQTDEYSLSISGSIDTTDPAPYPQYGPGPILSTLSLQAYATLSAGNDNQLTLVETVRRDQVASVVFSNDAQALLEWRVLPAAGIPLPLLPPDIGATGHFEHRESAEVTVGYQDSGDLPSLHPPAGSRHVPGVPGPRVHQGEPEPRHGRGGSPGRRAGLAFRGARRPGGKVDILEPGRDIVSFLPTCGI